ncbi:14-3-3 protein, putative [Plasmodium vinckei brucechwatti]|uniref:14-3-3 protein, putative n=1 Tax=Plasmodium vinckei brucechwatti TaxID=119398 RepID=A0A6V7SCU2_PLAVN|nr:14-3-3 protein, putative [Plasmodium vinckei brucechwatti]
MKSINDNGIKISNKEEFIYYLKILNQIGFYDEIISLTKSVNVEDYNLNYAESILMGTSFKNALNVKRKEKTTLENVIKNEESSEEEKKCGELLKLKINKDIRTIERDAYGVIKTKCIPKTVDDKILMFYWHLLGDIMRYSTDTFSIEDKKRVQERSLQAYSYSLKYANKMNLPPSNPRLLELLVSLTVLHKDMDTQIHDPIEMAAQAFRDAIQNMHLLESDEECSKTIAILGILRDNINKWCKISKRKNINALFEIKGEYSNKYEDIVNSINT